MSLALPLLDATLRGAALALLLVLAGALAHAVQSGRGPRPLLPLATALMLTLAVQVVGAWPWLEQHGSCTALAPLIGISLGNCLLFWLVVQALFDDAFVLRPWHGALWLVVVAWGASLCALQGPNQPDAWAATVVLAARYVPVLFSVLALWAVGRQARGDLVEGRRRLRGVVLVLGLVYAVGMAVVRIQAGKGQLSANASVLDTGLLLINLGVLAAFLLRLNPLRWLQAAHPPGAGSQPDAEAADADAEAAAQVMRSTGTAPAPPIPADDAVLRQLARRMDSERLYRQEALSLANLAAQLKVPEYRLRRAINQGLGHRNFNAYVNSFRLAEVKAALADPAQAHLPVLTLALSAGFGSIGPFNRAFKAATGRTPTEFRAQQLLTDS